MAIGKKKLRLLLAELRQARRRATMERMSVASSPKETVSISGDHDGTFHTDEFIRDRTFRYRESWIIGPLDRVIAELEVAAK